MFEFLSAFVSGFYQVFTWSTFTLMLVGIVVGFIVGILPGIGGPTALALMLPFIFKMTAVEAFAFLLGMTAVTATTGDITSVLFGVPGEPTTASTIVDGHAMAKKGEAGRALGAVLMSSLVGAVFGAFALAAAILDGQTPHADLYLSAGHAIYLQGLLIPVKDLVNGRSIIAGQHASALTLDYYHIELEDHDVVLAEGAPAETFGGDSRYGFDNAEEYERLYGSTVGPKRSFAPVVSLNGGRQELRSRLRSAISPIYDARKPLDIIGDQIASRAELSIAA